MVRGFGLVSFEKSNDAGETFDACGSDGRWIVSDVFCSTPLLETAKTSYAGCGRERNAEVGKATVPLLESPFTDTAPSAVVVSVASLAFRRRSFAILSRFFPVTGHVKVSFSGVGNTT